MTCDNASVKPSQCFPGGCLDSPATWEARIDYFGDGSLVDTLALCDQCYAGLKKDLRVTRARVRAGRPRTKRVYKLRSRRLG